MSEIIGMARLGEVQMPYTVWREGKDAVFTLTDDGVGAKFTFRIPVKDFDDINELINGSEQPK